MCCKSRTTRRGIGGQTDSAGSTYNHGVKIGRIICQDRLTDVIRPRISIAGLETKEVTDMLISRQALETHALAEKDGHRINLHGVLIEPDGATVATDAQRLVKYTPANTPDQDDYPIIPGEPECAGDREPLDPFILPADACKVLLKNIPKGRKVIYRAMGYARLYVRDTNRNGHATVGWTDLESPNVSRFAKIDGPFPKYQNVIPSKSKHPVGLNLKYLRDTASMLIKMGFEHAAITVQPDTVERNGITAEVCGCTSGRYKPGEIQRSADKPVRIDCHNSDGAAVAVIMPYHLEG